jgi:hypothetical protein
MSENYFLAVREENILKLFENKMLQRIFQPKREVVAGCWRRLRNEELHNLYASQNIVRVTNSRRIRWVGHVARMEEMRNAYNILIGKYLREKTIPKTY